jgi:hypothetical protein
VLWPTLLCVQSLKGSIRSEFQIWNFETRKQLRIWAIRWSNRLCFIWSCREWTCDLKKQGTHSSVK